MSVFSQGGVCVWCMPVWVALSVAYGCRLYVFCLCDLGVMSAGDGLCMVGMRSCCCGA